MSTNLVTVKEAAERFGKSDKTIYRLINRITSLPTHSDRHLIKPTPEEVAAFKERRKKIKYTISVDFLTQKFGQPKADHTASEPGQRVKQAKVSNPIDALYEQRITDLKEQLKQAYQREKELKSEAQSREAKLLDYAQADKQLFAKANENLTQVLALPGITEATKAQQGSNVRSTTSTVVDTTPKPQTVEQKPQPKSKAPTTKPPQKKTNSTGKKKPNKPTAPPRRSWLARKFFGKQKAAQP